MGVRVICLAYRGTSVGQLQDEAGARWAGNCAYLASSGDLSSDWVTIHDSDCTLLMSGYNAREAIVRD